MHEIKAIRGNVDKWIDRGRADSVPIRALMKEYIECLIDTGARAGKELLDLKWTQLELQYSPIEHKTGEVVADEFEPATSRSAAVTGSRTVNWRKAETTRHASSRLSRGIV